MKPDFRIKRWTPVAALALLVLSLPGCIVVPAGPPRAYIGPDVAVRPYYHHHPYRGYYRGYRDW